MKRNLLTLSTAVLALLAPCALSISAPQACQDNAHKITSLPSWSDPLPSFPCMYAGTFETSRSAQLSHNSFYWLVKNTTADPAQPLIVWIQGEIGQSAMQGLFV